MIDRARKQVKLGIAERCMNAFVESPMLEKANELEHFAKNILSGLDSGSIPMDASTVVVLDNGAPTVVKFDLEKFGTPRAEASKALEMAAKLRKQQAKIDALRRRNDGTAAALEGWQKRVRVAAARGEAEGLRALHAKLLQASKHLGLRRDRLAAFTTMSGDAGTRHDESFGI